MSSASYFVATFYRFFSLRDLDARREKILAICRDNDVLGTILIAEEGINGTLAGEKGAVEAVIAALETALGIETLAYKSALATTRPFHRLKVRIKQEIVALGVTGVRPDQLTGHYVEAEDWNTLISDPDVMVIDARNDYEVEVGRFDGAVNPRTGHFRELIQWLENNQTFAPANKVAMYCTGGIRCEKASAWLRAKGFDEVYQLNGGILKYLERVPPETSLWRGECFVFDERVAVGHRLEPGTHVLCRACRNPVSAHQRQSTLYVEGVSCPQCHALSTTEQKSRFAERQRQVKLAEERGQMHIGEAQQVNKMLNKAADTNQYQDGGAALPVLYSFRRCPYAMRARMAILVSGQTCAIREVALKNMPQEMLSASAKGTVPVLELPNGKVLDESLDIMHWALGIHDPEHWLTPPAETLQDVDAIVAVIDGQFKYHLDRYKYASRYQDADPDSERDAAAATLRPLVARLEIHSHLFGERPCFADIAAAPFVRQFANTDRAWFDAQSWTGLRRWLDAFLGSEMFNQVMTKYPLWRRDDPTTRFPS